MNSLADAASNGIVEIFQDLTLDKTARMVDVFRFGVFEVNAATGELRKQGLRIRLQDQPAHLLLLLLDRAGEVVSRDEIRRKLWPPDTFVDFDQSLGTALRKLRQSLNDDADTPRYIETIPKNGFRFLAPVERIASAADLPPLSTVEQTASNGKVKTSTARPVVWAAVLTGMCVLSFLSGWLVSRQTAVSEMAQAHLPSIRSSIQPPEHSSFEHSSFSLSPDGARLAFVAFGSDGIDRLWVRALSAPQAHQINGTDGALLPFWSPDGHRIGFFAGGKLNAVNLENGAVRVLAEAPFARCGGAWSRTGKILFSPTVDGPLYRLEESGGVPAPVTVTTGASTGQRHMWPSFLPDGKHFVYSDSSGPATVQGESIYVSSVDGGKPRLLLSSISGNVQYASGYLIFGRDRSLWAQSFNLNRLELSGAAHPISGQEIEEEGPFGHVEFSVSENGVLAFKSLADSRTALTWFDAVGNELSKIDEPGYHDPRLSPDGRSLAVSSDDARNGKFAIRIYDLVHGISRRLSETALNIVPAWTPDGQRITYGSVNALKTVPADGSGSADITIDGGHFVGPIDWSRNRDLVFARFVAGIPSLKVYSTRNRRAELFAVGAEPRFSPDGRWIAYVGPLTVPDADAIFVAPFPGPGARIRVSSGSGAQPNWARDGRHLFYIAPDRKLMIVEFDSATARASAARVLFQTRILAPNFSGTQYDVAPDGHFLINSFPANASSPLTLVTQWTAELQNTVK